MDTRKDTETRTPPQAEPFRQVEDMLFAMVQRISGLGYAGEPEQRREIKETLIEYRDFFNFSDVPEVAAHG